MKKVTVLFLILILLSCTSCKKSVENTSSKFGSRIFDNSKTISNSSIADPKDIEAKLKDYFLDNYLSNDIGILADVTSDDIVDLITVKKSDNRVIGRVYTFIDDQIKCIEEKTGGNDHASVFFNWYLFKNSDSTYNLIEENDGMWQGMGSCETIVYHLTNEGNRVIDNQIAVSSKDNNPINNDELTKYKKSISNLIGNSYEILYTSTLSTIKPKGMDDALLIQTGNIKEDQIESKNSGSSSQPISEHLDNTSPNIDAKSHKVLKLGKYKGEIPGADNTYAFITLEPNNVFTLEANIELDHFKDVKPFTRKGTYKYELSKSDDTYGPSTLVTWLNLYFDDEFYWTYAVVDNETFQDQAIVFSYLD